MTATALFLGPDIFYFISFFIIKGVQVFDLSCLRPVPPYQVQLLLGYVRTPSGHNVRIHSSHILRMIFLLVVLHYTCRMYE